MDCKATITVNGGDGNKGYMMNKKGEWQTGKEKIDTRKNNRIEDWYKKIKVKTVKRVSIWLDCCTTLFPGPLCRDEGTQVNESNKLGWAKTDGGKCRIIYFFIERDDLPYYYILWQEYSGQKKQTKILFLQRHNQANQVPKLYNFAFKYWWKRSCDKEYQSH